MSNYLYSNYFLLPYHLYHVRLIDGAGSIVIFYYMEMLDFLESGSIFIQPPHAMREKKPSENGDICICRWRESNLGCQHSKRTRYPLHHCPSAFILKLKKCNKLSWALGRYKKWVKNYYSSPVPSMDSYPNPQAYFLDQSANGLNYLVESFVQWLALNLLGSSTGV